MGSESVQHDLILWFPTRRSCGLQFSDDRLTLFGHMDVELH